MSPEIQTWSHKSRSRINNLYLLTRLIVTDIPSRTVSELSQLIVQILDTAFLSHPSEGLRKTYDVHLGLIGKRVLDFLLVLIELFC